jgi:hypothetical protein
MRKILPWASIKRMPSGATKKFYLLKQFGRVVASGIAATNLIPAELSCDEMVAIIEAQLGNAIS